MTFLSDFSPRHLQFYLTATYPCSYLAEQSARSQVVTPNELVDDAVYSHLIQAGFRRSGLYTYRPQCDHCRACVPVRLVVDEFAATRSQRRSLKHNQHLQAELGQKDLCHGFSLASCGWRLAMLLASMPHRHAPNAPLQPT